MNKIFTHSGQSLEEIIYHKNSPGIVLVENMVWVFVIVETLCEKNELSFLKISDNLKKHRETREFDFLLNGTLSYLEQVGDFYASEKSAKNGYTITELKHKSTGVCIHAVHTFDPTSKFRKDYLNMNSDEENPRYAIFRYGLNPDRTKLKCLEFGIPSTDGEIKEPLNLMPLICRCRDSLKLSGKEEAKELLQKMKMKILDSTIATLVEAEEK